MVSNHCHCVLRRKHFIIFFVVGILLQFIACCYSKHFSIIVSGLLKEVLCINITLYKFSLIVYSMNSLEFLARIAYCLGASTQMFTNIVYHKCLWFINDQQWPLDYFDTNLLVAVRCSKGVRRPLMIIMEIP